MIYLIIKNNYLTAFISMLLMEFNHLKLFIFKIFSYETFQKKLQIISPLIRLA